MRVRIDLTASDRDLLEELLLEELGRGSPDNHETAKKLLVKLRAAWNNAKTRKR